MAESACYASKQNAIGKPRVCSATNREKASAGARSEANGTG
jgi:hypothetical protein